MVLINLKLFGRDSSGSNSKSVIWINRLIAAGLRFFEPYFIFINTRNVNVGH